VNLSEKNQPAIGLEEKSANPFISKSATLHFFSINSWSARLNAQEIVVTENAELQTGK